jgi:hypothetical protein
MMKNKLYKVFGPLVSNLGILITMVGFAFLLESLIIGIIIVLMGIFIAFSYTGTIIDINKKRIKYVNYLFGIMPVGKWLDIKPEMRIGIKKSNKRWRMYSRSNRSLDINEKTYLLILYTTDGKEILQIKKLSDLNTAKTEGIKIAKLLGNTIR